MVVWELVTPSPITSALSVKNPRLAVALSKLAYPLLMTLLGILLFIAAPDILRLEDIVLLAIVSLVAIIMWAATLEAMRRIVPRGLEIFEERF